ncbi:hypothetical protein ABN034_33850 [Actinopolymorpha sp. B11F2]|uniref:hypothetical protein n=1 Tax=Actinopolymorpha sp. B11F2 TaxID=3160862 RepID=UPI0032E47E83
MQVKHVVAMLGLLFLVGCSSVDVREVEPAHGPKLSVLGYALGSFDMVPADSPEELIEQNDPEVIVVGAVEEIEQGRDYSPPEGSTRVQPYLVLRVRVSETLRAGDPGDIHDGRVNVEIPQGSYDADGNPSVSLEQWRDAIPEGTRTLLFLHNTTHAEENDYPTENEGRGLPMGANLTSPDAQGMIFEYNNEMLSPLAEEGGEDPLSQWSVSSIDELSARVAKYLQTQN